jgi:hypothetical protein
MNDSVWRPEIAISNIDCTSITDLPSAARLSGKLWLCGSVLKNFCCKSTSIRESTRCDSVSHSSLREEIEQ